MPSRWIPVAATVLLLAACGPAPSPSATPSLASTPSTAVASASPPSSSPSPAVPRELVAGSAPLEPGTYTRSGFRPAVTFAVEDGWFAGSSTDGFFDVQRDKGSPDVVAVQFARVLGMIGANGTVDPVSTATAAAASLHANPGVKVIDESAGRIGGLDGQVLIVENQGSATAGIMNVSPGQLAIDPGRRLWISMFDTPDGLLAIMVGGSVAKWDQALALAEPVLESVVVGAARGASADPIHIALDGRGPIGLSLAGSRAWVVMTDSGDLVEIDLQTQRPIRTIQVGTGGSQVIATDDSTVYVGRFDTGGVGEHLVVVDAGTEGVRGFHAEPIGGLGIEGSSLWALQKTGDVSLIDRLSGRLAGSVTVHVDLDAHMDVVAGAGSVWVSGDRTPVHRISGPEPHVVADIETGGGIPLDFDGGLVWGARPKELWAIDPATNAVLRRFPLENVDEILALDVDGDEAWIAARRPGRVGTVFELDLDTGKADAETLVSLPAGVKLTVDRVWVTDYDNNELIGIVRD